MFNLASGFATLIASLLAGTLWQTLGPPITFAAGAAFAAVALAGLFVWRLRYANMAD